MEHLPPESDPDPDLEAQLILLAATNHDLETLRNLLRKGSATVSDPDTGHTPLHSAIAACEHTVPLTVGVGTEGLRNRTTAMDHDIHGQTEPGHSNHATTELVPKQPVQSDEVVGINGNDERQVEFEAACNTLRLLLQNGAIWNDLDKNNETPGCIARRLGLERLYDIMVDAGVRAEILLNRLDGYEMLEDESDEHNNEHQEHESEPLPPPVEALWTDGVTAINVFSNGQQDGFIEEHPRQLVPAEIRSETYLASDLMFGSDRLLDEDKNGVMMAWETEIMQRTADVLAPVTGLRILNIGHGMGIIDDFFQGKAPSAHHIIEAHPAVISHMKESGWLNRVGVTVHEGRWQDVVGKLIEEGTLFDAIYFDTFAEDYKELHTFFEESVVGLLDDAGRWGFFNGLGADRQICYDVYTKVVEIDLLEAGFDVDWETVHVADLDTSGQWNGIKRPYWKLQNYRLPVCTFIG
ncbi:Arginine N-methyltransferase 2 [Lambiella insularis]|nr:Arginine N-methyltransferase 2 [Lambiella insularis]